MPSSGWARFIKIEPTKGFLSEDIFAIAIVEGVGDHLKWVPGFQSVRVPNFSSPKPVSGPKHASVWIPEIQRPGVIAPRSVTGPLPPAPYGLPVFGRL